MICFAWSGFPQYAARCIGAFVRTTKEEVVVVATRPKVPIGGMERLCGCPVHWLDDLRHLTIDLRPSVLIVSGWGIPVFNQLADSVRRGGGRVICMVDNNLRLSFREIVKAIRFRLTLRNLYDGFFVPGRSGRRLLRFYGVPDVKIVDGLYSADESLFTKGEPLATREKKIIYVGQFCERKNVLMMCEAFERAREWVESRENGEAERWVMELYGSGSLKTELERRYAAAHYSSSIRIHDFLQPEELAAKYREARGFCLPSKEEHWGLVVHEAALSGCFLLLSDVVGAAEDFAVRDNAALFSPNDLEGMTAAFVRLMTSSDLVLDRAWKKSIELATKNSLKKFVESVYAELKTN